MISGVRTRRGVEIVALHELGIASDRISPEVSDETQGLGNPLVIQPDDCTRLMKNLETAGTPVVCIYRSRIGSGGAISDEDEEKALAVEGPAHPGVDYLVLRIDEHEMNAARAFTWDGRSFVGREVRLEGE